MPGLRVIWPEAKPSEEVMKTVEYNPGYMADAVLLHENNPQYSVEEFYQFILDN